MLQSQLFTKTRREAPKDEVAKNAQLLIRAGFINKEMAGVYSYLPLGLRVLKRIENIIREEMNVIGGQEMFMTTLQDPQVWVKSCVRRSRRSRAPYGCRVCDRRNAAARCSRLSSGNPARRCVL